MATITEDGQSGPYKMAKKKGLMDLMRMMHEKIKAGYGDMDMQGSGKLEGKIGEAEEEAPEHDELDNQYHLAGQEGDHGPAGPEEAGEGDEDIASIVKRYMAKKGIDAGKSASVSMASMGSKSLPQMGKMKKGGKY